MLGGGRKKKETSRFTLYQAFYLSSGPEELGFSITKCFLLRVNTVLSKQLSSTRPQEAGSGAPARAGHPETPPAVFPMRMFTAWLSLWFSNVAWQKRDLLW